ncbi:helix-turn-helix protein [Pseudoduganella flava]|uniref:Helix-turn-helix domain-containing protein n=1 Tax=Pseudoduganella flava TaxID=871742 RepID=A0A562PZY2_9BURK|nr:AraC family transcriptional regulator [Pseudoduganella flava]QGZ38675.1 helix-turn-helix domain-containing protein [Pseudoduganella flava]TWI49750.1 helix-turn-helix protein [Pseudoduganella flava]
MRPFHQRAALAGAALLAASLALGYACVQRSHLRAALLPAAAGELRWHARGNADNTRGGASSTTIHAAGERLRFDLRVVPGVPGVPYPFAGTDLFFDGADGKPAHVDLSRYATLSFVARCEPANTLMLSIPTFDAKVSRRGDLLSYRTPAAFFSCTPQGNRVDVDLSRLETPQWWFDLYKQNIAHQHYRLDQVPKIAFGSTFQSPVGNSARVEISELAFIGRDDRYPLFAGGILATAWVLFSVWFFRGHTRALIDELREKLRKDVAIVPYRALPLEGHRDREKATLLDYLGAHYAQADLSVDTVVAATGINRNKLNDILKAELGLTFSAYLNKLRLTEAARLLAGQGGATVAEIAYSVGYANVSYFNKLFKEEHGCTPKAFRTACRAAA